jgi:hypothetical protein
MEARGDDIEGLTVFVPVVRSVPARNGAGPWTISA